MADVYGTIGNQQVELNNAATEATLRLLLQATVATTKSQKDAIKDIATKSGLDPAVVAAANTNLSTLGTGASTFSKGLVSVGAQTGAALSSLSQNITPLIKSFTEGKASLSEVFGTFSKIGGPLGMVLSGFEKLAAFQERSLQVYQNLSDSGIKFGGSLTTMRQAALDTYMTLDEFSALMKKNGAALASLGGTANDGAKNFVKLSNSLLSSEAGDSLRALGMTSAQVNEGLASYLTATGGRNRKELENTSAVTASAAAYMQQIDMLAEVTGKSREETEKALKEQSKNAAWQAQLQGMTEEEKKKAIAGLANALATGGKGAADAFQSKVMGVPPLTKEAQLFTATMHNSNKAVMQSADNVRDSSKTVADQNKELINGIRGGQKDMAQFSIQTQAAIIASGGPLSNTMQVMGENSVRAANQSDESYLAAIDIDAKKKALAKTEADDAAKAQKAVNEMGQALMKLLLPAIQFLTPLINTLAEFINKIIQTFTALDTSAKSIVAGLGLLALAIGAVVKSKATAGVADSLTGKAGAGGTGGANAAVKSSGKAMLSMAKNVAKAGGLMTAVVGGLSLYSDITDINAKVKEGKMTEEDASKAKVSTVTETGGGMAGGLAGAAAGAAIGSVVPVIGTIIGGLIGGALGAWGGGSLGKMGGDALNSSTMLKATPDTISESTEPQMADGGVVSKPTRALVGEAGPEVVAPIQHFENLRSELKMLNTQNAEIIRYLRETADNTRNNVNATRSLSGDLFRF